MSEPAVILLVEDREDDIILIRHAFSKAGVSNPIHVARDGEEAITYLSGVGKYANRAEYPLPELMLLDLKMPGTDGMQVLRWVRQQPGLNALRIVVLTSSDRIYDVNTAYQLGANSFMVKPFEFEDTIAMSRLLATYWLAHSKVPLSSRPSKTSNGRQH